MSAYDSNTKQSVSIAIGPTDGKQIQVGPTLSSIIDTHNFGSLDWIVQVGTITTGDFTVSLLESDASNMAGATAVSAEETIGTAPVFVVDDDDTIQHVGSIGKKRYQQLSVLGGDTPLGDLSAVAVQGNARTEPTS
jgi:hypothetical protein